MKVGIHFGVARDLSVSHKALWWPWLHHAEEVDQVTCYHKEASEVVNPMSVSVLVDKDIKHVDSIFELVKEAPAAVERIYIIQLAPNLGTLLLREDSELWPVLTCLCDSDLNIFEHAGPSVVDMLDSIFKAV